MEGSTSINKCVQVIINSKVFVFMISTYNIKDNAYCH